MKKDTNEDRGSKNCLHCLHPYTAYKASTAYIAFAAYNTARRRTYMPSYIAICFKLYGAEESCRRQGMAFFPLAAETFGWWHRVGEREVKKLGSDTRDRRRARLSTTSGVVWQFCCSGATLRFWETGFPTSHYHKLMDYISEKKYDLFSRCTVPDTI